VIDHLRAIACFEPVGFFKRGQRDSDRAPPTGWSPPDRQVCLGEFLGCV
jgi:hypothetical protein